MGSRTSERDAIAVVARVEWRSEGRWAERPAAVILGGERLEVEVEDRWTEGPATAGGVLVRCFVVSAGARGRFRIRAPAGGPTTVERLGG